MANFPISPVPDVDDQRAAADNAQALRNLRAARPEPQLRLVPTAVLVGLALSALALSALITSRARRGPFARLRSRG